MQLVESKSHHIRKCLLVYATDKILQEHAALSVAIGRGLHFANGEDIAVVAEANAIVLVAGSSEPCELGAFMTTFNRKQLAIRTHPHP